MSRWTEEEICRRCGTGVEHHTGQALDCPGRPFPAMTRASTSTDYEVDYDTVRNGLAEVVAIHITVTRVETITWKTERGDTIESDTRTVVRTFAHSPSEDPT